MLGYENEEVDSAVKDTIEAGNMSTLNCPKRSTGREIDSLHPGTDGDCRSGGEQMR